MGIEIEFINTGGFEKEDLNMEKPDFADYSPDIEEIRRKAREHDFKDLVVIGNGGSVTSFRAYNEALGDKKDKEAHILTTMEPEKVSGLSKRLDPEETLVMPISKSGETVGVIEDLMHFVEKGFPVFAVTSDNDGALREIVERKGFDFIEHPDISGRYTGATETGLVPAAFMGFDFEGIRQGAEKMYGKLEQESSNDVKKIASVLYSAEQRGLDKVFTPFYSTQLFGFYPLLVQLMHETVCKDGKGQTFFGDVGPECQHHTIQRLFGGKEDLVTMLFHVEEHESTFLKVDEELNDVNVRGRQLSEFEEADLADSLRSELSGVREALKSEEMPAFDLKIDKVCPETCGELLALLQYTAYYSAGFRGLNPFNQPDVEKSKKIGIQKRFEGD